MLRVHVLRGGRRRLAPPPRAVGRKLPAGRRPQVARKSQTGAASLGAPPAAGRLLPPARYRDWKAGCSSGERVPCDRIVTFCVAREIAVYKR